MAPRFSRLAIVNRGEPAMRVIHAVRELNAQRAEPISLIALHTEAERDAMFVRHADEAVALGAGYLDLADLERALREARADAVWVGWGFVAERPEFVELCERLGIAFVGPDAAVMRLVGDKIAAKRLAEEAGVPVAPWSGGPVGSVEEALRHAARIGFPLMIKAAAGGGGRGIRRVDAPDALPSAFDSAQAEAVQAFGDGTVLLEKLIAPARHVEVQIVADGQGAAWAVGLRDCSYQRRNQKVIEESSSPALTADQEDEVMQAARRLALRAGYRNAGTVEFLYEPDTERFSFMEVNSRLQCEHPVADAVTGHVVITPQRQIAACAAPSPTRWSWSTAGRPTRASCSSCSTAPRSAPGRSTPRGWIACTSTVRSCPCATPTSRWSRRRSCSPRRPPPPIARASTPWRAAGARR